MNSFGIWIVTIYQWRHENERTWQERVFSYAFNNYEEGHKFSEETWKKFVPFTPMFSVSFEGMKVNGHDFDDIDDFIKEELGK
jgi:hypothetical protein